MLRPWVAKDGGGIQGVRVSAPSPEGVEVWAKPLQAGGVAAIFLNRSPRAQDISADWKTLGLPVEEKITVRDLWLGKELAAGVKGSFTAKAVPSHGVLAAKLSA